MRQTALDLWQWALLGVGLVVVLYLVTRLYSTLWRAWRERESPLGPAPYDWALDDDLLNVWAREEKGEVLAVFPAEWNIRWREK